MEQEISLNIAYLWFCGLGITDKVPDHSTFIQNKRRRFGSSTLMQDLFVGIVQQCLDKGLLDEETVVSDGNYIPANISSSSIYWKKSTIRKGMQSYLDQLDDWPAVSIQPFF